MFYEYFNEPDIRRQVNIKFINFLDEKEYFANSKR